MSDLNIKRKFDDVESLVKFATGDTTMIKDQMSSLTHNRSRSWDLNTGYEKAIELLESGWREGADKIDDVSAELSETETGYIDLPSFEPSEQGEIVEPASYFAGDPECFYIQKPVERAVPVVKIGIPCCIGAGEDASSLVNRGLAMLALINTIEHNRINTELWIVHYSERSSSTVLYEIKVKASDSPFDMDKLAFICAHPAFFRRIVFATLERESPEFRKAHGIYSDGGYGTVEQITKNIIDDYNLLPDYDPDLFRSKEGSNKWIKNNAEKVGITITQ